MKEDQSSTSNQSPDASALEPGAPSGKKRAFYFALQLVWIAIKGLIVFLLLFGGANPAVVYQRF